MSWPIPKLRVRFSIRGFCGRTVSDLQAPNILLKAGRKKTYLGSLLASASLALGVGQSGGLLSGLSRRLSLRKKISVLFT